MLMFRTICKEVKRFVIMMLAVLICVITLPSQVNAYEVNYRKLNVNIQYVPHKDFGATSVTHMGNAVASWNSAMNKSYLSCATATTHNYTTYPTEQRDYLNGVYHQKAGWDYVGMNRYYPDQGTYIVESDININMFFSWANSAQPGKYDLWTVFLHEVGHTVGLADNSVSSSVMYFEATENFTRRSLTPDDIAGIKSIYG